MIITAANSKGGVGKTTIAVHLADWLRLHGWNTVLVDCDAQRLSSWWIETGSPELPTVVLDSPKAIAKELPRLSDKFDAVVVDAPGGLGETTGAILAAADAVFVPTGPSNLEIIALEWTTKTIHEIQAVRGGLPQTVVVPIRATAGRVSTRHLIEKAKSYGFGITPTTLPYREIYVQVSGTDSQPPKLLWQLGRRKAVRQAALEMDALFQGVFPEGCEQNPRLIEDLVTPKRAKHSRRKNYERATQSVR